MVAAGYYHTVGPKDNGTIVAVGNKTKLAKWNPPYCCLAPILIGMLNGIL